MWKANTFAVQESTIWLYCSVSDVQCFAENNAGRPSSRYCFFWFLFAFSTRHHPQEKQIKDSFGTSLEPTATLTETNSSHLKMDGWNISFLLGPGLFSEANLLLLLGSVIFHSNSLEKETFWQYFGVTTSIVMNPSCIKNTPFFPINS